jgi:hypothetical protein
MGGSGEAQGPVGLGLGWERVECMGEDRGANPREGRGVGMGGRMRVVTRPGLAAAYAWAC